MSATPPLRRVSLTASYRDLSERQIRSRLDGDLSDAERVTAQAELLRRGIESDAHDTTPATGFAPTGALDLIEAAGDNAAARVVADPRAAGRSTRMLTWLLVPAVVLGGAALFAYRHWH
jgi:hypothetical protein